VTHLATKIKKNIQNTGRVGDRFRAPSICQFRVAKSKFRDFGTKKKIESRFMTPTYMCNPRKISIKLFKRIFVVTMHVKYVVFQYTISDMF